MKDEDIEFINKLFFSRCDCFPEQKDDGSYRFVKKTLDHSVLRNHLKGNITIGVYQLDEANRLRIACFDIDADEDNLAGAQHAVKLLKERALHYGIEVGVEYSGRRGYHVWIFFSEPVAAEKAYRFCHGLLNEVRDDMPEAVSIEVFPKQVQLGDGPGSQIKLPLGKHRKTGRRCCFVGDDFEPFKNPDGSGYWTAQIEFLRRLKPVDSATLDQLLEEFPDVPQPSRISDHKAELAGEQSYTFVADPIQAIYENCAALRQMRDKAQAEGHLSHEERFILAGVMAALPGGVEEIHRVLANCYDYKERITQKHIDYITRRGMNPLSCSFICGCDNMRARRAASPRAFAFTYMRYEKTKAGQGAGS